MSMQKDTISVTELIFDGPSVDALIQETLQARRHIPTFGQRVERYLQLAHLPVPNDAQAIANVEFSPELEAFLESDPRTPDATGACEEDLVPAGLHLVKDSGIYLLSNADSGTSKLPHVVYAQGFDSTADSYLVDMVAGGDDFTEFIDLPSHYELLARQHDLVINMTDAALTIWVRARAS